jgi:hypothetical protein
MPFCVPLHPVTAEPFIVEALFADANWGAGVYRLITRFAAQGWADQSDLVLA